MTYVKQLYALQDLDLALDSIQDQKSKAEKELAARLTLDRMEADLAVEREKLEETQGLHREQQLEAGSLRERSGMLEEQLYSGAVANPRDLAALELEASHTKEQLDQREMGLLELVVQADNHRAKIGALETELADTQRAWEVRQAELTEQTERLSAEQESLTAERSKLAATVDQREMQRYELLRKSKGGKAVAKVERGLCQACRMSLPTQHLQRVRAGRETVLCNSCGRMLWPG